MRIMILLDHYRPGHAYGGPVRSIENLCRILPKSFDITVVSKDHDFKRKEKYNIKPGAVYSTDIENRYYLSSLSYKSLKKAISDIDPDLIYLNSFFSLLSIKFLFFTKIKLFKRLPAVMAPRGEFALAALLEKQFKKKIFLYINKICNIYSSIDMLNYSSHSEINPPCIVSNKPSFITVEPPFLQLLDVNVIQKEVGKLKLLFSGRIHPIKNLYYVLTVLGILANKYPNSYIALDIYGLIEDESYWLKCKKKVDSFSHNDNIIITIHGAVPPDHYDNILPTYHALFLPSKTENYGHSIVECMLSGVIPVISDNTPWTNLDPLRFGWSLPLGDTESFVSALKCLIDMNQNEYDFYRSNILHYAKSTFNHEKISVEYARMFNKAIHLHA